MGDLFRSNSLVIFFYEGLFADIRQIVELLIFWHLSSKLFVLKIHLESIIAETFFHLLSLNAFLLCTFYTYSLRVGFNCICAFCKTRCNFLKFLQFSCLTGDVNFSWRNMAENDKKHWILNVDMPTQKKPVSKKLKGIKFLQKFILS